MLSPEERFWSKVQKQTEITSPHVDTPCWLWVGSKDGGGYGNFKINGKTVRVHRFSFLLHGGVLTKTFPLVCHKCDNRVCVNPNHHFAGNNFTNTRDMIEKNRHGIDSVVPRFDSDQIIDMFRSHIAGESYRSIAKRYSTRKGHICQIFKRKMYKNVILPSDVDPSKSKSFHSLVTEDLVRKIRLDYGGRHGDVVNIAKKFSLNYDTVREIIRGRTWKHVA